MIAGLGAAAAAGGSIITARSLMQQSMQQRVQGEQSIPQRTADTNVTSAPVRRPQTQISHAAQAYKKEIPINNDKVEISEAGRQKAQSALAQLAASAGEGAGAQAMRIGTLEMEAEEIAEPTVQTSSDMDRAEFSSRGLMLAWSMINSGLRETEAPTDQAAAPIPTETETEPSAPAAEETQNAPEPIEPMGSGGAPQPAKDVSDLSRYTDAELRDLLYTGSITRNQYDAELANRQAIDAMIKEFSDAMAGIGELS